MAINNSIESESGRPLPATFAADISSGAYSIIYRVIIEANYPKSVYADTVGYSDTEPTVEMDNPIYISTHKTVFDKVYYKPLLLEAPIIKHSIGIEDKKFKISTIDLKI